VGVAHGYSIQPLGGLVSLARLLFDLVRLFVHSRLAQRNAAEELQDSYLFSRVPGCRPRLEVKSECELNLTIRSQPNGPLNRRAQQPEGTSGRRLCKRLPRLKQLAIDRGADGVIQRG